MEAAISLGLVAKGTTPWPLFAASTV